VNFTCGAVNGATRYEFRLREPSGSFISLQPVAEGSRISQSYTITQAGAFRGQCRACSGETEESCQVWE
jgi:hypothetical protein